MTVISCEFPTHAEAEVFLKCQLPEATATVFGLDSTGWTMVTAVGTCLLAVFALAAWIVSKRTLNHARDSAQISLAEQETSRQIQALVPYIQAVNDLLSHQGTRRLGGPGVVDAIFSAAEVREKKRREVHNTGLAWRLHHYKSRQQMKPFEDLEEAILQAHNSRTKPTKPTWQESAGDLIELASKWQGDPTSREATSAQVNLSFSELWDSLGEAEAALARATVQEDSGRGVVPKEDANQ